MQKLKHKKNESSATSLKNNELRYASIIIYEQKIIF